MNFDLHYEDECPITLEPFSDLPYPPFLLTSSNTTKHYFDGAALATYIVSQGTFTNPLTREPLQYGDCVLLDEYLDKYVFNGHNYSPSDRISVREAWSLRESIKVNVSSGVRNDDNQRRREEALRNEASVALRGLFVFGHERNQRRRDISESNSSNESQGQTLPNTEGGFNLYHRLNSTSMHSWGLASTRNQEGLLVIDDDEAAFEAADLAAWQRVQDEFPTLGKSQTDNIPNSNSNCDRNDSPSQILATVRRRADLTIKEEKEKQEAAEKTRHKLFLKALERKRQRINARRKAKEEAAKTLLAKKESEDVKISARDEIDRWLCQKWNEWERYSANIETEQKADNSLLSNEYETREIEQGHAESSTTPQNTKLSEEERAAKVAAKKKAKRQKAKERAKEKKRLEKLEREKKERAIALQIALQKEKELSAAKCAHCGEGIIGCGFEKFDKKFCSTKCARSGAK